MLERLWNAAHVLHAEGSTAAEEFVNRRLRMLLEGRVGGVIGGLRQMLAKHALSASKRKALNTVIGYCENNQDHMRYDRYLAAGYPIGSGVAEGACRHLVKDRMEQTGMRWTVDDHDLTEAGQDLGTKRFMAPEQSQTSRVDSRADLYSLC